MKKQFYSFSRLHGTGLYLETERKANAKQNFSMFMSFINAKLVFIKGDAYEKECQRRDHRII